MISGPNPGPRRRSIDDALTALAKQSRAHVTLSLRDVVASAAILVAALIAFGALRWTWGLATLLAVIGMATQFSRTDRQSVNQPAAALEPVVPHTAPTAATAAPETADSVERLLSTVIAGLPDAALILDRTGLVFAANRPSHALYPIAVGRRLAQISRVPELLRGVDTALATSEPLALDVRLPPPLERTLDIRIIPLRASDDMSAPAVIVILRDMTEQDQLSRMRADFVANASHELRTPLASLKGFVETLQGAARDDPSARDRFLAIMQEQASRMSRLIDDLLSLSRIEMREHVAPTATIDLAPILNEVIAAMRPLAATGHITIETDIAVAPAPVVGDADELAQIIQNLVQNAIKYGRAGGKIQVALAALGDRFAITVTDDGIGIAAEHLPRLTERFYRVSAKESRERGGTGLGLAIVKHIVNRHRGDLRVTSTPGVGSTFTVLLPAARP